MNSLKNFSSALILFILFIFPHNSYSDSHNIKEIIDLIQKDLKTLERAVYSESFSPSEETSSSDAIVLDQNSEDVLTRHLLKLSEIEM